MLAYPSYIDGEKVSTYFESTLHIILKSVTAKMSLSLSISGHTLVMESLKLGPRVKVFKKENDLNNLTLGLRLRDSITKVRSEIERLSDIFAVAPFSSSVLPTSLAGKTGKNIKHYIRICDVCVCCVSHHMLCTHHAQKLVKLDPLYRVHREEALQWHERLGQVRTMRTGGFVSTVKVQIEVNLGMTIKKLIWVNRVTKSFVGALVTNDLDESTARWPRDAH